MINLLSKFKNQFSTKFKQLSPLKKIALISFILFGLFWYWANKTIYYYIIHTLGIPQLSSIIGISTDTLNWIFFILPFYFKLISMIIFLPIILFIIIKKKKKSIKNAKKV